MFTSYSTQFDYVDPQQTVSLAQQLQDKEMKIHHPIQRILQ